MQSIELLVKHLGLPPDRRTAELFRFQIFDGSSRVVIEAQSEEDARYPLQTNELGIYLRL